MNLISQNYYMKRILATLLFCIFPLNEMLSYDVRKTFYVPMHAVSLDYNCELFKSFEDHLEFEFFTNKNGFEAEEGEGDSILYFPGDRGNPFVIAVTNTKGADRQIKVYQIKAMGESQGDPFEYRLMECLKKTINFKDSFWRIGHISDSERAKCRVAMKIEKDIIAISQEQSEKLLAVFSATVRSLGSVDTPAETQTIGAYSIYVRSNDQWVKIYGVAPNNLGIRLAGMGIKLLRAAHSNDAAVRNRCVDEAVKIATPLAVEFSGQRVRRQNYTKIFSHPQGDFTGSWYGFHERELMQDWAYNPENDEQMFKLLYEEK